jgi:hypothetical protein
MMDQNKQQIDAKPFVDTDHPDNSAQNQQDRERRETSTNPRDLGSAGGGRVPGSSGGSSTGGPPISDSTVEGSSPGQGYAGAGQPRDRGSVTDTDLNRTEPSESTRNTIDRHARTNIGGRNPNQPQTAMGERDARAPMARGSDDDSRRDYHELETDPMLTRSPDKVNDAEEEKRS